MVISFMCRVIFLRSDVFIFPFLLFFLFQFESSSKIKLLIEDKIKRTLGEGTFGKVVEVKDLYE